MNATSAGVSLLHWLSAFPQGLERLPRPLPDFEPLDQPRLFPASGNLIWHAGTGQQVFRSDHGINAW